MKSIDITPRYLAAIDYARTAHAGQVRKGTTVPYFGHLIGVSSLVLDFGGDEDQAIAGLLHDVLEDCGAHHLPLVRDRFGERVAAIVSDCTDGTSEDKAKATTPQAKRANWKERKERYLDHLAHVSNDTLLVSGCDKLHNLRAIVSDLRDPKVGKAVFERFTAGREGTQWYYASLVKVLADRGHKASAELQATMKELLTA